MLYNCFCMCPCCSLVCWALQVFSPPARRGSLDFNRGAGPSPSSPSSPSPACLPLCQLRMLPCLDANCRSQAPVDVDCAWTRSPYRELRRLWSVPGPDRHIASSGGCGVGWARPPYRERRKLWSWTFGRHGFHI